MLYQFPSFTTASLVNDYSGSGGPSTRFYVAWERRFAQGLTVLGNYQFSKQLWARQKLNPSDTFMTRSLGSEDRPHQLTISSTYELPFGPKRSIGAGTTGIVARLISGWQVNGIFFRQSGSLISWPALVFTGNSWSSIMNVDGKGNHDPSNGAITWFNPAVFDRTAANQPNIPNAQTQTQFRYFPTIVPGARTPWQQSFDLSFGKRTAITERVALQFRAEMFNAFNHPLFASGPTTSYSSALFGKITSQSNAPRTIQLGLRMTF